MLLLCVNWFDGLFSGVISLIDDIVMAKSSVKHALRNKSVVEPADHEMHVYKNPVKSKKKTSRKHLNNQALDEQVELPNVSTAEKDFNFDDIIPRPEIDENDEEGDADDVQISKTIFQKIEF